MQAKPITVLFLGMENSCRSVMAAEFFKHYIGDKANVITAGTEPEEKIDPLTIEVMKEKGINIAPMTPCRITAEIAKSADRIVAMGVDVQDTCPILLNWTKIDSWALDAPAGSDITFFQEVRDRIYEKVAKLLEEFGVHINVE